MLAACKWLCMRAGYSGISRSHQNLASRELRRLGLRHPLEEVDRILVRLVALGSQWNVDAITTAVQEDTAAYDEWVDGDGFENVFLWLADMTAAEQLQALQQSTALWDFGIERTYQAVLGAMVPQEQQALWLGWHVDQLIRPHTWGWLGSYASYAWRDSRAVGAGWTPIGAILAHCQELGMPPETIRAVQGSRDSFGVIDVDRLHAMVENAVIALSDSDESDGITWEPGVLGLCVDKEGRRVRRDVIAGDPVVEFGRKEKQWLLFSKLFDADGQKLSGEEMDRLLDSTTGARRQVSRQVSKTLRRLGIRVSDGQLHPRADDDT
jgi:hypothetical protein